MADVIFTPRQAAGAIIQHGKHEAEPGPFGDKTWNDLSPAPPFTRKPLQEVGCAGAFAVTLGTETDFQAVVRQIQILALKEGKLVPKEKAEQTLRHTLGDSPSAPAGPA